MTNSAPPGPPSRRPPPKKKEATPPQPPRVNKVRVLCLHGYRQNGEALKNKMGSFRKIAGQSVEFVYIDAPHQAKPLDESKPPEEQLSWWANKEDGSFKGTNRSGPAFGFQESLRAVEAAWKEKGPFEGLLGFSQGACFVGIICGLAKKKITSIKPEFVVIAAGFRSHSLVHMNIYEEPLTVPSLHIYGLADAIIPKEMSMELADCFKEDTTVVEHEGGHYLAATAQQKAVYQKFFKDQLELYLRRLLQGEENIEVIIDPQAGASGSRQD